MLLHSPARLRLATLFSRSSCFRLHSSLSSWIATLTIVTHGFGMCGDFEDRVSNGIGVYLSPANFPIDWWLTHIILFPLLFHINNFNFKIGDVWRAREDEYGVKHLLLCRVILGNTEKIAAIPAKLHTFRHNLIPPLQYTIWGAYMNSHVLPDFIFSFTAPSLTGNYYHYDYFLCNWISITTFCNT